MWVVILGSHQPYHSSACWGPFSDEATAKRFAAYAHHEIDPAQVVKVLCPVAELLNWRDMQLQEGPSQ